MKRCRDCNGPEVKLRFGLCPSCLAAADKRVDEYQERCRHLFGDDWLEEPEKPETD